jgi:hypothetical protein
VSANPPADENAVYLKYLINTAIDFYRRGNAKNTGSELAVLYYAMSENVPRLPVNVIGGVLNFSEPSNHANIPIPSGKKQVWFLPSCALQKSISSLGYPDHGIQLADT